MHQKFFRLLCLPFLMLLLAGCGKDPALEEYKENITAFIEEVTVIHDDINHIDMSSETRVQEFLGYMDKLNDEFQQFAELEVPSEFSSIEELADDAAFYMAEAVSLYHRAFEAEELDMGLLDAASENYRRANKRKDYIATILQGELPEDESVTIEYLEDGTDIEEDFEGE